MSDPDQMINYFTKMDTPHIVLSHEKTIQLNELPGQSLRNTKKNKNKMNSVEEKIEAPWTDVMKRRRTYGKTVANVTTAT